MIGVQGNAIFGKVQINASIKEDETYDDRPSDSRLNANGNGKY